MKNIYSYLFSLEYEGILINYYTDDIDLALYSAYNLKDAHDMINKYFSQYKR